MEKLDEKHLKIKFSVKLRYKEIKKAETALKRLRKQCKHPITKLCNYMWAPGHISPNTKICSVCGEVMLSESEMKWTPETTFTDETKRYKGNDNPQEHQNW